MIELAIEFVAKAHEGQKRKGTQIPYIAHPYRVGIILLKEGYPDELVVAGILHDTIEEAGVKIEEIRDLFGDRVASIVEGCTEPNRSLPWKKRKEHTIEYLKNAPLDIKIVSCADKLDNIRSMISDYEQIGDKLWTRFNTGKDEQAWYYRSLVESFLYGYGVNKVSIFNKFKNQVNRFFNNMD